MILSGAAFGSSALGAIGSHQSASAAASAQNEGAKRSYNYQLKVRENNWRRQRVTSAFDQIRFQKETGVGGTFDLASRRGYVSEQQRLNNIYEKAGFAQQDQLIKLAQSSGQAAASGMRGKNAERLDVNKVNAFRLQQQEAFKSLLGAQAAYGVRTGAFRRQRISASNDSFSNVAIAPEVGVAPPAPVMRSGPSGLSLAAGLMGAVVDGAKGYKLGGGKFPGE